MLKWKNKRFIIRVVSAVLGLLIIIPAFLKAEESADFSAVKPLYIFQNKGGRDPFYPRYMKQTSGSIESVDITTLSLQGVTESNGIKSALLKSRNGLTFGYIFTDGRLYGDNDVEIADVTGEFKGENELLLRQGDREITFSMPENADGPNIGPADSGNTENSVN
jgi:hypothetical protein